MTMADDETRVFLREELGTAFGEMRTFFREELGTAFVVFRGEVQAAIQTAIQASEERMQAAIQASEERMQAAIQATNQHVDQVQQNVLELKGNVALLDQKVDRLDHKVNELEGRIGGLERRVDALDGKVGQMADVLDEVTVKFADMQQTMFNLENKVDTYHTTIKQDVTRADATVQVLDLNHRLTNHIATPWNKAHPDPNSAA
jgi:chromosome segregation ATPase